MKGVRSLIRHRWSGGLLAVGVAYALAIQALMASVGLGMLAAAAPAQTNFVICSSAFGPSTHGPATNGDRKTPNPQPECPFCFVAAQSAGHLATTTEVAVFPAYAEPHFSGLLYSRFGGTFVPAFRRTVGDPRAPPSFSV